MEEIEARNLATYVIEPVGADIHDPDSFTVRQIFQGNETTSNYTPSEVWKMFDDIMFQMTNPTISGSNMRGGLLYLKNGTYTLNADEQGILVGGDTDGATVSCKIVGETKENTRLNAINGMSENELIKPFCTLEVESITFNGDGENGATGVGINPYFGTVPTKILRVKNCRFTNFGDFDIKIDENTRGFELSECQFDNHQIDNDQVAIRVSEWAQIHDNLFDKTTGVDEGEMLTSGELYNADIYNNILKRTTNNGNGISTEGFDVDNENIHIHNNTLVNCDISVGSYNEYTATFRNVVVDSNTIFGGSIRIDGTNPGDYSDQIRNWSITNNNLFNSYRTGIEVYHTAGIGFVRNNTICNSNAVLGGTDTSGCISLEGVNDCICENNSIYMGVTSPENAAFSPFGIKYNISENLTLRDNKIINRTVANPSYIESGSHTGTKLISRSL
jgi:hypothetical protein